MQEDGTQLGAADDGEELAGSQWGAGGESCWEAGKVEEDGIPRTQQGAANADRKLVRSWCMGCGGAGGRLMGWRKMGHSRRLLIMSSSLCVRCRGASCAAKLLVNRLAAKGS